MSHARSIAVAVLAIASMTSAATGAEVPADDLAKIRLAAPYDAPAPPRKVRRVLVFSRADGYYHDSIPWGAAALKILGEKSGAYAATLCDDPAMFDREQLFEFDAVVFNNNCGNPLPDATHRANLLEFVRSGRGLAGIHCAAHLDWPEYTDLLGGYSISHPWYTGSTVTVELDEPDHPLVRCFASSSFQHTDEIFEFEHYSREKVRVLLSLDTARTDMQKPEIKRIDGDFALSWIRNYGQGRVFYSALGHQPDVYWRPTILKHYLAGIQFALGDLEADATPSAVSTATETEQAAATPRVDFVESPLSLSFCCRADNDLYRVVTAQGGQFSRSENALDAIRDAPEGSGVLILADGYPAQTTQLDAAVFEQAEARRLRLYVEFPSQLPGMELGAPVGPRQGDWGQMLQRAVVTSDAFGPGLKKKRILMINDCHHLPVQAPMPHLVLARVSGFDTARFGLPEQDVHPILFEHPRGDILVSTTKLSQFVTARYGPTDAWSPVWQMILGWLQPGKTVPELKWTPIVRPVYGPADELPPDFELQTIRRGTQWFIKSRLLVHPSWQDRYDRPSNMGPPTDDWPWGHRTAPQPDPSGAVGDGGLGMLEGFRSRVLHDGSQAVLWWRRHDNTGEIAGAMSMAGTLLDNEPFRHIAGNLGDWLYTKSLMTQGERAEPDNSAFGLAGWNDVPRYYGDTHGYDVYYADDNARGMLGMIKAATALQTDRWDERLAQCLLANLRITSQLGFSPERIDGPLPPDQWRSRFDSQFVFFCPHHQAYMQACFLWAYRQTGDRLWLDRAQSAIRLTMEAYPERWTWTNGQVTLERARFILPLAWLVRVEDTPEHRGWLDRMVKELLTDQVDCGALRTRIVHSPTSNEAYGTGETSLIEQNGDPVSDLLYESNFALVGLHEAAAATGNADYRQAEDRLAEYICRIQARSETHPELNGVWYRGFDFQRWQYWAADADVGWSLWSTETGWTQAEIISTLVLRQLNTSLWEYTVNSRISRQLDTWRRRMLPDEVTSSNR